MALAVHNGGPANGVTVKAESAPQVRYYAPVSVRSVKGWVALARYVFVPPRVGAKCQYRYTGEEQVQGPVVGAKDAPEWS